MSAQRHDYYDFDSALRLGTVVLLERGTQIRNVQLTADDRPRPERSWKKYYENQGITWPEYCCLYTSGGEACRRPAVHGAHVKLNGGDNACYIVPFCAEHNSPARSAYYASQRVYAVRLYLPYE